MKLLKLTNYFLCKIPKLKNVINSFFQASSYSNQFHGDFESNERHVPLFNRLHHNKNDLFSDYDESQNSLSYEYSTTTEYPTRFPSAPYFYPRDRIWSTLPITTTTDISNEIVFYDDEKPIYTYDEKDVYGPSNWHKINRECGGNLQSPINLETKGANVDSSSQPLTIVGIDAKPSFINVENNGHSLKLSFNYPNNKQVEILGGPLEQPYILENVHWHWGKSDRAGSEHTLNSKRFSAEMHVVTYNSKYGKQKLIN